MRQIHGNKYILTLINHCIGWVEAKPIPSKELMQVVGYLEQKYLPKFGAPEVVITDQGLEFNAAPLRLFIDGVGSIGNRHATTQR